MALLLCSAHRTCGDDPPEACQLRLASAVPALQLRVAAGRATVGLYTVHEGENDSLDVVRPPAAMATATVSPGVYTAAELQTALVAALVAAVGGAWAVVIDPVRGTVEIDELVPAAWSAAWASGPSRGRSMAPMLGFDTRADQPSHICGTGYHRIRGGVPRVIAGVNDRIDVDLLGVEPRSVVATLAPGEYSGAGLAAAATAALAAAEPGMRCSYAATPRVYTLWHPTAGFRLAWASGPNRGRRASVLLGAEPPRVGSWQAEAPADSVSLTLPTEVCVVPPDQAALDLELEGRAVALDLPPGTHSGIGLAAILGQRLREAAPGFACHFDADSHRFTVSHAAPFRLAFGSGPRAARSAAAVLGRRAADQDSRAAGGRHLAISNAGSRLVGAYAAPSRTELPPALHIVSPELVPEGEGVAGSSEALLRQATLCSLQLRRYREGLPLEYICSGGLYRVAYPSRRPLQTMSFLLVDPQGAPVRLGCTDWMLSLVRSV